MKKGKSDPVKLRQNKGNKSNKSSVIINKETLRLDEKHNQI